MTDRDTEHDKLRIAESEVRILLFISPPGRAQLPAKRMPWGFGRSGAYNNDALENMISCGFLSLSRNEARGSCDFQNSWAGLIAW